MYHSNREFCRSIPASRSAQARRAFLVDFVLMVVVGSVFGAMLAWGF